MESVNYKEVQLGERIGGGGFAIVWKGKLLIYEAFRAAIFEVNN